MLRYKFVELSIVTDETIEQAVNEWVAEGWQFDGMHLAMQPASKRPSMPFSALPAALLTSHIQRVTATE